MSRPPPTDEKLVSILNNSFGKGRNPSVAKLNGPDWGAAGSDLRTALPPLPTPGA